jgi:hypothetical protein
MHKLNKILMRYNQEVLNIVHLAPTRSYLLASVSNE